MTADYAYKVGRFLGWYYNALRERNGDNEPARIVIGKDTRRSSYMFEYSLVAGLTASGADAYLLHVTTTPSVAYIARVDDFDCGIMISASHNPYYDNGIIRHDFVELILRYKILDFLLEDPFVGIKTEYLILSDKFDIALKDLLQRTVFLQETELYQKIIAFCGKWNKYNGYIGLKVQPSNNGQYVRMNQVLMEDYEEIEAIVQRMKSEICEIYESISQ